MFRMDYLPSISMIVSITTAILTYIDNHGHKSPHVALSRDQHGRLVVTNVSGVPVTLLEVGAYDGKHQATVFPRFGESVHLPTTIAVGAFVSLGVDIDRGRAYAVIARSKLLNYSSGRKTYREQR